MAQRWLRGERKKKTPTEPAWLPAITAPHCDSSILHAPGECLYCDDFPHWQELRELWCINFTDHMDSGKTPCPSIWFRDPLIRDLWGGNVARPDPV